MDKEEIKLRAYRTLSKKTQKINKYEVPKLAHATHLIMVD